MTMQIVKIIIKKKKLNYRHHEGFNGRTGLPYLVKTKKNPPCYFKGIVMEIFCFGQNCTKYWTQYLRLSNIILLLKHREKKILKFRFCNLSYFSETYVNILFSIGTTFALEPFVIPRERKAVPFKVLDSIHFLDHEIYLVFKVLV